MNIALLGYGKMGQIIEALAISMGDTIKLVLNNEADWDANGNKLAECDVAIDFSVPEVAVENILRCFKINIPVVCGTTGWHNSIPEIKLECAKHNGTLFYASNFSIGVNIFMEINRKLASIMQKHPDYQLEIEEIHHLQKLDSPSGTAISLANDIITQNSNYTSWSKENSSIDVIKINSLREGSVPGTHTITWKNEIDKIEIKHEAYNRKGFATGALLAAKWICDKKGVFTMKDLMSL